LIRAVLLFIFLTANNIYPQGCCSPGSSFLGSLELGGVKYGTLVLSLGYELDNVNRSYNGTVRIDNDPLRRNAGVQYISVSGDYGIAERISVSLVWNVLVSKHREITVRDTANNPVTKRFTGSGFGDITALAKYKVFENLLLPYSEVDIGFGTKLPIGSYTQEEKGTRLPIDLQPGNGAIELISSLYLIKSFPKIRLNLNGNFTYRYVGANFNGYKVGDEMYASVFANYNLFKFLNATVGVRARHANKDFSEGRFLSSTGGTWLFLIPGLIYREGIFNLRAFYQIPVYQNLPGIQLTLGEVIGAEAGLLLHIPGH
jgi:hypothetical protein